MHFDTSADHLNGLFEQQMELCNLLEHLADSLPSQVDRQQCLHLARTIRPLLARAHAAEEKVLFPVVVKRHEKGDEVVERLRLEHLEDEYFAEEVQLELAELGKGVSHLTPDATGYMLRGFFEGIRRHVRHERELLGLIGAAR